MRRNSARCRFLLPCGISFGFRDCFGTSTPFVARRHFRLSLFEGRRLFGARYRRGLPYKDFPRRAGTEKWFRQKLRRASVSSVFASFARRTRIQPYKDNKWYTVKRYRQQAYIMVREQCPLFFVSPYGNMRRIENESTTRETLAHKCILEKRVP